MFSASLSQRRQSSAGPYREMLSGHQLFLASVTVAELRFGALVAGWGESRRFRLEQGIESTTVIPVTDALLTEIASFRFACRQAGHPLADRIHANDLWIAASAIHIAAGLVTGDAVFAAAPGLTVIE